MFSPHSLRSGLNYKMNNTVTTTTSLNNSITTVSSSSPVTTVTYTTMSSPVSSYNPRITLLHQEPSIKRFSGENLCEYSALNFLQACEDTMTGSSLETGSDKISFVWSQLVTGSLAAEMMSASAFSIQNLDGNYEQFRTNFLQAFGTTATNDFQWTYRYVDSLQTNLGNLGHMRAQARSAELATDAITALNNSSWIQNGSVSEKSLRDILEFQYYISFLTPSERRIASGLEFKPGDNLLNFSSQIRKKLKQLPQQTYVAPIIKPLENRDLSVSQKSRDPIECFYCHKLGHSISQCRRRKRSQQNSLSRGSSPTFSEKSHQSTSSSNSNTSYKHKNRYSPSRSYQNKSNIYKHSSNSQPTCIIHGIGHFSKNCRKLQQYLNNQTQKQNRNFQQVPPHQNPT